MFRQIEASFLLSSNSLLPNIELVTGKQATVSKTWRLLRKLPFELQCELE